LAPPCSVLFDTGRQRFLNVENVASGLGPSYNGTSCGGCHNQPSIAGVGNVTLIRAGVVQNGRYEAPQGGDLVHLFSVGDYSCQPQIPANANNLSHRIPIPLYGAGLIEAIPDSVIRTWENPTGGAPRRQTVITSFHKKFSLLLAHFARPLTRRETFSFAIYKNGPNCLPMNNSAKRIQIPLPDGRRRTKGP